MTSPLTLAVVSAGLSQPSSTRLLADRLAEATSRQLAAAAAGDRPGAAAGPSAAVAVRVRVELRELATDIAQALVTGFPNARLRSALDTVTGADGLIAVTPIFNASYSGLFKSFFDLVDASALTGLPTLLGATGGSTRHSLALDHALRPLFAYLHADTVPTAVYAASADWGSIAGRGVNPGASAPLGDGLAIPAQPGGGELSARIERAGRELAARMLGGGFEPRPRAAATALEDDFDEVTPFAEQLAALRPEGSGFGA